jgi:hypothetical protein
MTKEAYGFFVGERTWMTRFSMATSILVTYVVSGLKKTNRPI